MPIGRTITDSEAARFLILARRAHRARGLPVQTRDDCAQDAALSLVRFARRYRGSAPFMAMAALRAWWETAEFAKRWARARKHGTEIPIGRFDRPTNDPGFARVDAADFLAALRSRVTNAGHRRAIDLLLSGATQRAAARAIGVDESRVCQIVRGYLRKLAEGMDA